MQDVQSVKYAAWGGAEVLGNPVPACLWKPAFLTSNLNPAVPLGYNSNLLGP